MRTKQLNVCHTCRRHKIGCDGKLPSCTQCKLTDRSCGGYIQELLVVQHKPSSRQKKCTFKKRIEPIRSDVFPIFPIGTQFWPTYEESVAVIVQRYIPSHEIPFLSPISPSRSRICGGWVQALPYVSQTSAGFERVLLPAVRALVMSMMITSADSRRQYLHTYGDALRGVQSRISKENNSIDSAVSLASMCLTLSEVMMPTTSNGWTAHIQGVAAMMQSRGPSAFTDGIPHLLFVGFRPLIVLEALIKRRTTFLMDERWRTIPFSIQYPSPMQVLLGHASVVPSLLEQMDKQLTDRRNSQQVFQSALDTLQTWEDEFLSHNETYQPVASSDIESSIPPELLPETCFDFLDVSHANSLSHCWAFRIVCLLQLSSLEQDGQTAIDDSDWWKPHREEDILGLCTRICQGLPYLLQPEMSLYGPLSAAFPLRVVSQSLKMLQGEYPVQADWCNAIQEQLLSKGILPL